mmetsp:Transcript_57992/g.184211  ORF Transcript_57992/g.184211 Transcript_57992/m.184211 type:complete len:229 (-) Transcript_57992:352-1038(-)
MDQYGALPTSESQEGLTSNLSQSHSASSWEPSHWVTILSLQRLSGRPYEAKRTWSRRMPSGQVRVQSSSSLAVQPATFFSRRPSPPRSSARSCTVMVVKPAARGLTACTYTVPGMSTTGVVHVSEVAVSAVCIAKAGAEMLMEPSPSLLVGEAKVHLAHCDFAMLKPSIVISSTPSRPALGVSSEVKPKVRAGSQGASMYSYLGIGVAPMTMPPSMTTPILRSLVSSE